MQKFLAAAVLCTASFAMPVLPTQAAPMLSETETNCLIFPMLKKECWELGAGKVMVAPAAATEATVAAADAAAETAADMKMPVLWNCTRAPVGSGHLLDC